MTMAEKEPSLLGNEKLEKNISSLQRDPSPEMLAVTLTTLRRLMNAGNSFVAAVEMDEKGQPRIGMLKTGRKKWIVAYTGFEEQMAGGQTVQSTFLCGMKELLLKAAQEKSAEGILVNPWNRTLRLDRHLIEIVLGQEEHRRCEQ